MSAIDANALDTKFDDGIPSSGRIFGTRQSGGTSTSCTNIDAFAAYGSPAQATYNNTTIMDCVLALVVDF